MGTVGTVAKSVQLPFEGSKISHYFVYGRLSRFADANVTELILVRCIWPLKYVERARLSRDSSWPDAREQL